MAYFTELTLCTLLAVCSILQSTAKTPNDYPSGSLSCKLFESSSLDCANRNLSAIPSLTSINANITYIDLQNNLINELQSSTFSGLNQLFSINLNINRLHNITGSPFLGLASLAELVIANNNLTSLDVTAFKGLHNLWILDLSKNKLLSLPDGIFSDLRNLMELDLSLNYLQAIPSQAVAPLRALSTLDLSQNYFTSFTLGEGFRNLHWLISLQLWSIAPINNTVFTNDTFNNLADSQLLTLHFQFNGGHNNYIENGIFKPLTHLQNLKYAHVFDPLTSISSNLKKLTIIFDGELTDSSFQPLSKLGSSLTELTITLVSDRIGARAFKQFPNLQVLDLSNIYFSLRDLDPEAFLGLDVLQQLYLKNDRLTEIPTDALMAFAKSQSLLKLDLSYNTLSGQFQDDAFISVTSLSHLYMSYNPIYKVGKWINRLTNLLILNLDYNTGAQDIVSDEWTTPLLTLQQMTLSYPANKDILRFGGFQLSKQAPNLKVLLLEEIYIYDIAMIQNLVHLQSLFVSGSFTQMENFNAEWNKVYFPNLETLNLSLNKLKSVATIRFNNTTPALRQLDLGNNNIQVLDKDTFSGMTKLEYINLEGNGLQSLGAILTMNSLQTLLLPRNDLINIPKEFLEMISSNGSTLRTLDLSSNPYACTCDADILHFQDWILSDTTVLLQSTLPYQCSSPKSQSGLSITQQVCTSQLTLILSLSISCSLVVFAVAIVTTRYRWHIRYKLFVMCNWRREYQLIEGDMNNNPERYDAFVSYAHDNDDDLDWVLNKLKPNMEDGEEPIKLCIGHARDFIPGTSLLDAITNAIHESRKTIVVLTLSYLESEWCYFETQQAWLRLLEEGQDVLILVMLEPIPDDKMTLWLRQFLCRKGPLKWPEDKLGQKLFWECLREMVKTQTLVDRRYDV